MGLLKKGRAESKDPKSKALHLRRLYWERFAAYLTAAGGVEWSNVTRGVDLLGFEIRGKGMM